MPEGLSGYNPEAGAVEEQETPVETEVKKKPIDSMMVFGFGIQTDQDLEKSGTLKPEIVRTERQRLSIGAKLRTVAAAELFFDGQVGDVIFTGGHTKQAEGVQESEAEIMEGYFLHILAKRKRAEIYKRLRSAGEKVDDRKEEIDQEIANYMETAKKQIIKEDKSTNTIENFTRTINLLHRERAKYTNVGLLSSQFHLDRISKLARKHLVEGKPVSAEGEVTARRVRYQKIVDHYFSLEGNNRFRKEVLSSLTTEAEREQAENKLGTSFGDYLKGEERWSRGLDEVPEYWMQGLQFIEDENHLRAILVAEKEITAILESKLGKSVDEATQKEIQATLSSIDRIMPPVERGESETK